MNAIKTFFQRRRREVLISTAAILVVLLIVCVVVMIDDYSKGLDQQAEDASRMHTMTYGVPLNDAVDHFVDRVSLLASQVPNDRYALPEYLKKRSDIAFFRYVKDGVEYRSDGSVFPLENEDPGVRDLIKGGTLAVSGRFDDSHGDDESTLNDRPIGVFAVYAPVEENEYVDGLIAFYFIDELERRLTLELGEDDVQPTYFSIASVDGTVVKDLHNNDFPIEPFENLYVSLRAITNDVSLVDDMKNNLANGFCATVEIEKGAYVISVDSPTLADGRLYAIGIFRAEDVYRDGYMLVGTIGSIIAILAVILVALLAFTLITRLREINEIEDFENHDPVYGCLTYRGFAERFDAIMLTNRVSKYAMVYISIPHIDQIRKMYGDGEADNTLKYIVNVFGKAMLTDEAFCMIDHEKYAMLIHYNEVEDIYNRMTVLNVVLYNCPVTLGRKYNLKQSVGVALIDREADASLRKNLDNAITAERAHDLFSVSNVRIFTERLHEMFLRQSEIESKMEASLQNGDFKLFFQPKYNIDGDRIDSAEVLVRWYDSEYNRFYQPSEFLPLFEANGFIREVDRFMFIEVCRTIQRAYTEGMPAIPLSVNVSRVTALDPDFLSFYVGNKRKYNIPDNLVTLEFTDSFVFENLDSLRGTVAKLHADGIRCSIDNFGAGHSSLNVLKLLAMDELKLDRFFIKQGVSRERDDQLLVSIIELAKKLNMTVVQQGVEDLGELDRLRTAGCDKLQGYLYSRPLPVDEYADFIALGGKMSPI